MYENLLLRYIISPTRVTPRSQTLIDNIFPNIIEEDIISGNIITTISDHYIQFVLFKNKIKSKTNIKKANFARNYKSLNKDLFEYDLRNTKWDEILKVNRGDVDFSFESFLKKFNEILDKHAPYQCCIQQLFGGASFSTSVVRRKTVVQLGSLGGTVSPPQWDPGTKPQKILAILHSE